MCTTIQATPCAIPDRLLAFRGQPRKVLRQRLTACEAVAGLIPDAADEAALIREAIRFFYPRKARGEGRIRRIPAITRLDSRRLCDICGGMGRGVVTVNHWPKMTWSWHDGPACTACEDGFMYGPVDVVDELMPGGKAIILTRGGHHGPERVSGTPVVPNVHQRGFIGLRLIDPARRGLLRWCHQPGVGASGPDDTDLSAAREGKAVHAMRDANEHIRHPKRGSRRDKDILTAGQERRSKSEKRVRQAQREHNRKVGLTGLSRRESEKLANDILAQFGLEDLIASGEVSPIEYDSPTIAEARRRGDLPPCDDPRHDADTSADFSVLPVKHACCIRCGKRHAHGDCPHTPDLPLRQVKQVNVPEPVVRRLMEKRYAPPVIVPRRRSQFVRFD